MKTTWSGSSNVDRCACCCRTFARCRPAAALMVLALFPGPRWLFAAEQQESTQLEYYDSRIESLQRDMAARQEEFAEAERQRNEYSGLFQDLNRDRDVITETLSRRREVLEYEAKRMEAFQTWNAFAGAMDATWQGLQKINPGSAGSATANFVADRFLEIGGDDQLRANMSNLKDSLDGMSPAQVELQRALTASPREIADRMREEGILTTDEEYERAARGEHRGVVTAGNRYIQEAIQGALAEIEEMERIIPQTFERTESGLQQAYRETETRMESVRDEISEMRSDMEEVEFFRQSYSRDRERQTDDTAGPGTEETDAEWHEYVEAFQDLSLDEQDAERAAMTEDQLQELERRLDEAAGQQAIPEAEQQTADGEEEVPESDEEDEGEQVDVDENGDEEEEDKNDHNGDKPRRRAVADGVAPGADEAAPEDDEAEADESDAEADEEPVEGLVLGPPTEQESVGYRAGDMVIDDAGIEYKLGPDGWVETGEFHEPISAEERTAWEREIEDAAGRLRRDEASSEWSGSAMGRADGRNLLDRFADRREGDRRQQTDTAAGTMDLSRQLGEATRFGDLHLADARRTREAAGRDAQAVIGHSARDASRVQREQSWGTAMGDALADGIQTGAETFASTLGAAAAEEAAGRIFRTRKAQAPASGGADEPAAASGTGSAQPGGGSAPAAPAARPADGKGGAAVDGSDGAGSDPDARSPGSRGGSSLCPRCGRESCVVTCRDCGRTSPQRGECGQDAAAACPYCVNMNCPACGYSANYPIGQAPPNCPSCPPPGSSARGAAEE